MLKLIIIKTSRLVFKNFTYLLVDEQNKNGILIDPAWEIDKYKEQIRNLDIHINAILLTHHHLDHSHLANDLAKLYDCPVYLAHEEIQYYNFKCHNLVSIPRDVEYYDIHGVTIRVLRTPGHTYGGVCYLLDNYLFTGDTLFVEGCGICSTKGGNPRQMYDTFQMLKSSVSNQTLVYPGHQFKHVIGQSFQFVLENNIYMQFTNPDDFVKFRMRKGQSSFLNFA